MIATLLALALAAPLDAPTVRVASKKFTESVLLAELAAELAEIAGARAVRREELGGTRVLWEALLRGDVDLYPDYTGTLWREILGRAPGDAAELERLLSQKGVAVTRPLGFQDSYAIGMRRALADRLGIETVSDLARHPELHLAFTDEFMDRAEGWPALRDRYRLAHRGVRGLDHDIAYRALSAGEIDATDLYTTDAEIRRYDLRALADDRQAFPEYQAVLVYRADLAERAPLALTSIRRLEGRISAPQMIAMNARVRFEGAPAAEVTAEFLATTLDLHPTVSVAGFWARLLQRTEEHVLLVAIALSAAMAVAIPLGIWAARRRRAGKVILGVVGIVQTVPSLALLVFMIPILGIGARPAVAALALYGLLPVVRNTHAGLVGIPPDLRESAEALGLSRFARLRLVELPLASPSILAGVKTSAVITVGTATLGALVGAGGYGQPILTGIRLASTSLILEGAIPAALLALAVQGLFDLLERALVPRGLTLAASETRSGSR
ncbi:MAG TPA: glycine betaine ABC transporter substrate-binding protein [Anaeromyxobacteraceae bacterium]|nr:glycine betaine ABC transporter substrate-binding protein [Anaeromyxobacteraceae bacterium]